MIMQETKFLKRIILPLLLIVTGDCFIPLFAVAQTAQTLEDCYRLGMERNIQLKQAQNNINARIIDKKTAQNLLLPSVSYSLGHYFSFGKNIDPVSNSFVTETFSGGYTAMGLQVQLFSGFSRINTIKQSSYLIKSLTYEKKRAELELLSNITIIYSRILSAREQLAAVKNNIEGTVEQSKIINEKIKAGRLTKYEGYLFDSRYNSELSTITALQNDSLAATQDLKQLLNIPYQQEFEIASIDTTVLQLINKEEVSIAEFIDSVVQNHPAIKEAQMQAEAARLKEKITKGNFYPSIYIGTNLVSNYNANQTDRNGSKISLQNQLNNNLGRNINIGLRIPIFSQFENANRIKKERINISNAELATEEARNLIVTNTLQVINDFKAAKEQYNTTTTALQLNKLSYNLYEEKYKLGQISSMELLNARDIVNNYTSRYIQAKLQLYFQFKIIELLKRY